MEWNGAKDNKTSRCRTRCNTIEQNKIAYLRMTLNKIKANETPENKK